MRHSPHIPLVLALGALTACADSAVPPTALLAPHSIATSSAAAPLRTQSVQPVLFAVRGSANPASPMLSLSSPPGTLLFTASPNPTTGLGMPVFAPDGHQLTLGEWITPSGRAAIKCIPSGTHTVLHFSHLVPNGTYTVWQLVFMSPGFVGNPEINLIALGALGPNDGSANSFRASSSGEGELSAVTPGGNLSIFGAIAACATDEFEVHYLAAYHIDGLTHGPTPGPDGTFAEDAGIIFRMP